MKKEFTPEQRAVMEPVAEQIRELRNLLSQQQATLAQMAAMVEPKLLDRSTGVKLLLEDLVIEYPEPEEKPKQGNRASRRGQKTS